VGSHFAEIEAARYMPRERLTRVLDNYDVIQIVAGSPAVACAVATVRRPKCLSVGTTILQDRNSALAKERGLAKIWRAGMTGINLLLERRVLARMDHVFAQSSYTHRLLEPMVPDGRLSMGSPGVDTSFFRPGDERSSDDYILSVARFSDPRKNVELLFRAYALLRDELGDPPRLLLAGTAGPSEGNWAVARQLGIAQWIEFRQNPPIEELATLYRGATVFALSSDEEGFGMVLVEAMASGIAVVSTRCGGPESVVVDGQTGYLTPVRDHRAMAARLAELLKNESLRRLMADEGRRLAEARFSIEAAGFPYLQVYDRLLSPGQWSELG
jgi:glycosyltransferase involved in cell wall biosynthesis